MPPFNQTVDIGHANGARFQRIIAQVDPASFYSIMPAAVLTMLGVESQWTWVFQLADGSQVQRHLAEIGIKLEGQQRTTVCVFGEPQSEPVLGKHTLDAFGLDVDETNQRLVAAQFGLG